MAGEGICHMTALTDQNGIKDTQSLQASGTGLSTGDFFFPTIQISLPMDMLPFTFITGVGFSVSLAHLHSLSKLNGNW